MRDISCFETEYGTVGLVLNQIPYTQTAYIHVQIALDLEKLIVEAVKFCVAVGAEAVYITGNDNLSSYPCFMDVFRMQMVLPHKNETDACLMPVTEQTLDRWLSIYHEKMAGVDGAAHISYFEGKKLLAKGGCYFIHRDGAILGIGEVCGDVISCVAAVKPGTGADVVLALCNAIMSDKVCVEVASTNTRAINLYQRLGFLKTSVIRSWYRVR